MLKKHPQTQDVSSKFNRYLGWLFPVLAVLCMYSVVLGEDDGTYGSFTKHSFVAPRTADEQGIIDVYKRANKAVVNVSTKVGAPSFFGSHYQEGSGSGVVIDAQQGYVVTNFHVIRDADQAAVTLASGQGYAVKLLGQDPGNDLALLQILNPPNDLAELELGDSSQLEVGQRVLAIGNPFGLSRTLSLGVVSSLGRSIQAQDGRLIEDIIQIDAAINPGNSGGPLLDTAGRIVGLNTAILSSSGDSAGIGFAIPVNQIRKAIPQFIKYGKVLRPKLGVMLADTDYGLVVLYVQPNGPADNAGISGAKSYVRRGLAIGYVMDLNEADFIISINGKPVGSKAEALDLIGKSESAEEIAIVVRKGLDRRTKQRTVMVKPELG